MSLVDFYKYQGAGNDFIIIDNRDLSFTDTRPEVIARLCNRRFGIGADGFMLLNPSQNFDFEMVYYNADGNLGSMCGNGGRCIVAFARKVGVISESTTFMAVDGAHLASINASGNWVSLKMQDVNQIDRLGDDYVLNTGSPHYVKIVNDLEKLDVAGEGALIRYGDVYKNEGINVNFASPTDEGYAVRTYERGVEDETLACGTGVTAVALAMASQLNLKGKIETPIRARGGNLVIRFRAEGGRYADVFLEGPAEFVFKGTIELS